MKQVIIILIEFYQNFLSFDRGILAILAPGGACKNQPTCSEYTKQQVKELGVFKGLLNGTRRILTCR